MKRWGISIAVTVLAAVGVFAGFGLDPGVLFPAAEDRPATSPSALPQVVLAPAHSSAKDGRREPSATGSGEAQVAINRASTGSTLPPAPIPQPLAENFGNWRVRCALDLQSNETCYGEQILHDEAGRPQLAVIVHAANAGKAARLDIRPPWGISVAAGVVVQVDGNGRLRAPMIVCHPVGCQATLEMPEQLLASLRTGTQLQMRVVSAEGQVMTTSVPLAGFGEAYGRLSRGR